MVDVDIETDLSIEVESPFSSPVDSPNGAVEVETLSAATPKVERSPSPSPIPSVEPSPPSTPCSPVPPKALKILFLSSDTGGGHRASSESLANQFQLLYPGSTYEIQDVFEGQKSPISFFGMEQSYRHLSAHPTQWKIFYEVTNSRAFEMWADANMKLITERATRKRILSIDPDVVVSVHPMMTNVPQLACAKILNQTGKHIPIFTVVTDLGSGHCLWFANGMEKMFVGSDQIWDLAKKRGNVPDEKLVKIGLPIRHDFAVQAEKLGDRTSEEGKAYQRLIRKELEIPEDRRTILVMGGGEGVGSLSNIVNALYVELTMKSLDATVLVVCGRNEKLKASLEERNWEQVRLSYSHMKVSTVQTCYPTSTMSVGCIEGGVTSSIRKILSTSSLGSPLAAIDDEKKDDTPSQNVAEKRVQPTYSFDSFPGDKPLGNVKVVGLGFVTRMAEYMVAADVLVSKAGPGTISEAASLSLPIMLTSFLPGQEEGNVDFVLEGGFGAYCNDKDPAGIAEEVVMWLSDELKMQELSRNAKAKGAPHAARDIAKAIGDSALKWKEINEENGKASIAEILAEKQTTTVKSSSWL